ncbi:hypothetical protein Tco_1407812 [Tanacetum coccineum]
MLLTQLQEAGIQLSKDQLTILADTKERIDYGPGAFTVTTNALFQADEVEVYDSDCDDVPNAQPSFMANISSYGLDALVEVHNPDNVDNNMINHGVQVKLSSKQSSVVNHSETEITSDSNSIPYSYVNDSLTAELERYKEKVNVLKEEHVKEKESLMQTITLLKNNFKKEETRNIDREIALEKKIKQLDNIVFKRDQSAQIVHMLTKPQFLYDHTTKQALGFQNPFYLKKAQQLEPKLYDGNVIKNASAIVIPDSEETLRLAEESRSKMILKQQDPMMLKKKVNTTPVDYASLNQLSQDIKTRFVPQTKLSAEQAFWSQNSKNSSDPTLSIRPTKVEVPKELPKVSMVNTSLKKLKHHLAGFDVVVKERTTTTAITEGTWGFEHTKACFRDEIIPFVKALKDLFNTFNQYLIDELSEVKNVFHQMEQAVEQHRLKSKTFQEIFQRDNSVSNQGAPSFDQYFEINELKAQSQEKDTVIIKLKERIKSLSGKINEDKIKKDLEEIETINIELDHRVSKLIAENEHLKQTYKQLYDSIKPTRVRSKEQCDALVNQVNQKSVEISDLNASLQEKVLVITALKNELRKLKGKSVIACRESVNKPKVIAPVVHKEDLEPLSPKLKNNREAHVDYIRITKENADTLRDIVEQARTLNPLDNALAYACMYTKQIQELLVYVSDTCPSSPLKSEKLVSIIPINKARKVTFAKTSTTSYNNIQIQVDVHQTQTTSKPLVPSTNEKCSTNASISKPHSETKNHRIMQPLSSNQKYQKIEAHTRNAKPSLTKEDSESKSVCLTCNKCFFDARHDLCVVQYLSKVNDRARAKAVKSIKMKEWKPTGKMFKNVGYKWVPIGKTFTIVGTKCALTKFTSTKIVPPRKHVKSTVITNIKPSSASQWRPKETNHVRSSNAPKIVESRTANHLEPKGSNVSISTCSSSVQCRSYKSYFGNWIRAALHI